MAQWQGFFKESKRFWGYPHDKWGFWLGLPGAWARFHWYVIKDWWRRES